MSNFCGGCGAQRGRPDQLFCQECGTPFGAAKVSAPEYAVPAGLPRRGGVGGRVGLLVGAGLLVLALVGGGLVGWQVFGPKGGAETPEEAVRQFLEAGVSQDVLGALDMVNPAEVDGLDSLVDAARERLADEDLTTTSGDLTDALTITLEDLEFDTDELGDSAARVLLEDGSYTVEFDPDELPDRLAFAADSYPDGGTWSGDLLDELGQDLPDANWDNDDPDPFVSTVKIDGRWYVSALGTFVDVFFAGSENELREEGISSPDYDAIDDDRDPIVGEEPEDVLDNLVDAADGEDVAQLLANFPADEVAALRPWATTLEDAFADEGMTFDVSLDGVDASVDELGGDLVRLTIERGSVFGSYQNADGDYDGGSAGVDGRCVSAGQDSGDEESFCIEDDITDKTGIDSYYLILRKVDGGYQVDPIATAIDYASTVVESAPSSLVDDALEEIEEEL